MGLEAHCVARSGSNRSEGTALLESDHLLFRGDFRFELLFKNVRSARALDGELTIDTSDGEWSFSLGAAAERWAKRILNPPTRLDKLGIKPGSHVVVQGVKDTTFLDEVRAQTENVSERLRKDSGLIFFAAERSADLAKLKKLRTSLSANGALWVVYPKGVSQIREADVLLAGREVGLTDTKVVAFSATHTALKFVIPVRDRGL